MKFTTIKIKYFYFSKGKRHSMYFVTEKDALQMLQGPYYKTKYDKKDLISGVMKIPIYKYLGE